MPESVQLCLPLDQPTKRCTECGETKPLDDFYVKYKATGVRLSRCKQCHNARKLSTYHATKGPLKRDAPKPTTKTCTKCGEVKPIAAFDRRGNSDRPRSNCKACRYQKRSPEVVKASRERAHEHRREYNRAYREAHPDLYRAAYNNRRARLKGNGGTHTTAQWEAVKAAQDYTCLHCGKREPDIALTRDHIHPLSKGGTNDIVNIQGLCALCNSRKSAKVIKGGHMATPKDTDPKADSAVVTGEETPIVAGSTTAPETPVASFTIAHTMVDAWHEGDVVTADDLKDVDIERLLLLGAITPVREG